MFRSALYNLRERLPSFKYTTKISCALASYSIISVNGINESWGTRSNPYKDSIENVDPARKRAQIAYECVHEAREGCRLGMLHGRRETFAFWEIQCRHAGAHVL